jgi:hypothetical protein
VTSNASSHAAAAAGRRRDHFSARSTGPTRSRPDRLLVQVALQLVGQLQRRGEAPARLLFQAFQTEDLQVTVHHGLNPTRRNRLVVEDLP